MGNTKSWWRVQDGPEWVLVWAADEPEARRLAVHDPFINALHGLVVTKSRGPDAKDMGFE